MRPPRRRRRRRGRLLACGGVAFDLAQVNVSRLLAPLDSPLLAEFMAALDEVNVSGDQAAGLLWRLQAEDGNATSVRASGVGRLRQPWCDREPHDLDVGAGVG